jgi:[protein-PII] uridylyltransferase
MNAQPAAQHSFQTARDAALTDSPFAASGASPLPITPLPKQEPCADWDALRKATLPPLQGWLALERAHTRAYFERTGNAFRTLRQYSDAIDQMLQGLLRLGLKQAEALGQLPDAAREREKQESPLALLAIGGYGRRELFPYSDLDILLLHNETLGDALEPLAQFLYYVLWDLGFKVGQSVRTLNESLEASQQDHTVLTALLDARLITGQRRLLTKLIKLLQEQATEGRVRQFTEEKLSERDARHEKHGNSRYLLEPNIKDGKGGLRDLHTLYWIARYAYGVRNMKELVTRGLFTPEEYLRFQRALRFLCVVRMELHYMAGRPEERLTFDRQRALAEKLDFRESEANRAVERFMKRYFLVAGEVGSLTRLVCASLEAHQRRAPKKLWELWKTRQRRLGGLVLEGERLAFPSEEALEESPLLMFELFRQSLEENIDIHPAALQQVARHLRLVTREFRESPEANQAFLAILLSEKNPVDTLRRMREVGLLGKFLPDFARVVGQMQFDMFHIYTVDEHILRAVGILHDLERGQYAASIPIASEVVGMVQSRRVLFLCALTHDIAKGRGGDHAKKGAAIARQLAKRFGFSAAEADIAEWLVLHHQEFSDTAHKRDLTDPDTIRRFVDLVQSLERLRLLLVLTVVDMQAVGPHIWNGWKAALLRELYRRSEQLIRTGSLDAPSPERALGAVLEGLSPEERQVADRYIDEAESAFLGSCPEEEHALILTLLARIWMGGEPLAMDVASHIFHDISRVIVIAPDRAGLLADVTGAFAREGVSVAGARITTLKSGWAVQLWQVQDVGSQALTDGAKRKKLQKSLEAAILAQTPAPPLPKQPASRKHEHFDTPIELFFENGYSGTFTILEITAPDRVGLLHTLCRTLANEGITIASAHIGTYGEKAVDVFYLKDRFGMKLVHPGKLKELQGRIEDAIRGLSKTAT